MPSLLESMQENEVCALHVIDLVAVSKTEFSGHPGLEEFLEDEDIDDLFPGVAPDADELLCEVYDQGKLFLVQAATALREYFTKDSWASGWGRYTMKWFKGPSYEDCMKQAVKWAKAIHKKAQDKVGSEPPSTE